MKGIRLASLCFVGTLLFAPLPAHAQSRPATNPGADNSVAARVAALEARLAKLESGQVAASDMAGTYVMFSLGIELNGQHLPPSPGPAEVRTETSADTITLNAGGTISASVSESFCRLLQGNPWTVTCHNDTGSENPVPGVAWSVQNGMLVIADESKPGEPIQAFIGAGGNVLIAGGSSTDVPNHGWSNLVILVRLPNP